MIKRRVNARFIVALGGFLALLGIFGSSFTKQLPTYLVFYTLFNGVGTGMCYMVPLVCNWEHFPENKGLMSGITLSAYGFSSFIFAQLSTWLINPDDVPCTEVGDACIFPTTVSDRMPHMMRVLGYVWLVLVVISIILISRPPEKEVVEEEIEQENINLTDNSAMTKS
mmetsp:Transcript_21711/g.15553  ORF Transcript_21711/g.15553 Transcript_21711/m.15553 type:complete len:168 (-) Transcript_21711:727-1230(-)